MLRLSLIHILDLHEASPEYPTINTIVAHQRAAELGAQALLNMQLEGMSIGLSLIHI